jgi:Strictosidine synthase
MLQALRNWGDTLLGRGSAAITVPVMDGSLKPNRVLDEAAVVGTHSGLDDLASSGGILFASAGPLLLRLAGKELIEVRRFDDDISAMALSPAGRLAVALGGRRVLLLNSVNGTEVARLESPAGRPLVAANALAFDDEDQLLVTDGSAQHGPAQWCHDLMALGRSGRVLRWHIGSGRVDLLAADLQFAFGVLPTQGGMLFSESWQHRVVQAVASNPARGLLAELPGYPSRMTAASGGGFWLTCFVCRTQLVEFVLREPAYRTRMVAEIDPRYWIAPALSSGNSFLEPLQGAGVKQMGVLKPWAPPRSYGLVLKVAADGRILESMHSQVDGKHHGITAIVEHGGALFAASKGSGKLLRVELGSRT